MAKFVSYSKKIEQLQSDLKLLLYNALKCKTFRNDKVMVTALADCYGVDKYTNQVRQFIMEN